MKSLSDRDQLNWAYFVIIVKFPRISRIWISCSLLLYLIRYKALRKTPWRKRISNSGVGQYLCFDENGANIDRTGDKNLKGEDGVGVEENGSQPEGVEVVQSGKHHFLVHVEPACTKVRKNMMVPEI